LYGSKHPMKKFMYCSLVAECNFRRQFSYKKISKETLGCTPPISTPRE
jgi:hypothetical protein